MYFDMKRAAFEIFWLLIQDQSTTAKSTVSCSSSLLSMLHSCLCFEHLVGPPMLSPALSDERGAWLPVVMPESVVLPPREPKGESQVAQSLKNSSAMCLRCSEAVLVGRYGNCDSGLKAVNKSNVTSQVISERSLGNLVHSVASLSLRTEFFVLGLDE